MSSTPRGIRWPGCVGWRAKVLRGWSFWRLAGRRSGSLWRGAEPWHWAALVALVALVLAIEAINTALEILVDRVSPEWSLMAKEAKDLGSLAVGLMLLVSAGFVALVITGVI